MEAVVETNVLQNELNDLSPRYNLPLRMILSLQHKLLTGELVEAIVEANLFRNELNDSSPH